MSENWYRDLTQEQIKSQMQETDESIQRAAESMRSLGCTRVMLQKALVDKEQQYGTV